MKFIGMDAHSSTCTFSVMDEGGVEMDNVTIQTNGKLLIEYIRRIEGKKKMVFEECELSHWLYDLFRSEVDDLIVCSPVHNRAYKKVKTDKLDARGLANLLRGGFLTSVYHDGTARERFRSLMSGYEDLIQESVRLKCRYKSLFRKEGKWKKGGQIYRDEKTLTELERPEFQFMAGSTFRLMGMITEERKHYVKEIVEAGKKFKEMKYLGSVPGIGRIQASKIVAQVIDPGRFKTKYRYFSYCGLVRHRRISGGRDYGSEEIHGNKILKCVYRMAGYSALRGNNGLKKYYDQLREHGTSHENAYHAVCRKIAAISLSVWRNRKEYNDTYFVSNHLRRDDLREPKRS